MPIYEFRCQDCGREVEILVRGLGASLDSPCPGCKGTRLEKLMSRVSFTSKGEEGKRSSGASCARPSCGGCTSHCR